MRTMQTGSAVGVVLKARYAMLVALRAGVDLVVGVGVVADNGVLLFIVVFRPPRSHRIT